MSTRSRTGTILKVAALAGAALVVYALFFNPRTRDTVKDSLGRATRSIETAALSPGPYMVQLEWLELADEDWTTNAVVRGPKAVHLSVVRNGREIYRRDLGAFRGKKSFLEEPVTFNVPYDGTTPITLELAETEILSDGRRYVFTEAWPFAHATLGRSSRASFTWKPSVQSRQ